ncbi:MAG TPA: universal stress protein [Syntrophobacteraceae bacterium]|nr:universal stress protein [Syntrophobacteraceae bacterium]
MNIQRILIAYDGSPESERAYEMALDLASRYTAELVVVSVARPPEPPIAVEMEAVLEHATEYYRSRFASLKDQAFVQGVEPRFEVRIGHPAEQIVILANEEEAGMIVMGHRGGGSFLQQWRLGSIARRVMNYAQCTVVVVR